MAGVLYDGNNVAVGQAALMLQPWTAALQAALLPGAWDLVPLFTPANTAWANYFSAGATNEGFKVNVETSTTQITIEEQSNPVDEKVESKAVGIEAILAESTLESMKYAWGGSAIALTAASTGKPSKRTMTFTDDTNYYIGVLETRNFLGFARRLIVPKMSITGSGEVSFRRAADKQMFPIRCASLCRPSEITVVDITSVPA